ncbi:MAG: right-handed parallel beta-helix repeat-containing protein [Opitutales bacterium]
MFPIPSFHSSVMLIAAIFIGLMTCGSVQAEAIDIQKLLDRGEDVLLEPGSVHEIEGTLIFRKAGQRIETAGAINASGFAKIVLAPGSIGTLVNAHEVPGATLKHLILDAQRSAFFSEDGVIPGEPMLSFGGEGGDGQEISHCIVLNSRSAGGWGAIHVQEGASDILIANNVVFGAGADIRGNGRAPYEKPFGFGDGISTASTRTRVFNNLIYDVTDEGIMLQGAPGSHVKDNVIVAIGREMLGGIALIDPFGFHQIDAEAQTFDYRDIVVEENYIAAIGARIHVGVPLGGAPWNGRFAGTTLIGATVKNNHIAGGAGGYGFVVDGIEGFEVRGNTSDAIYSGLGDGWHGVKPDAPAAFLFNPETVGASELQDEFVPMKKSLTRVIRSSRGPKDSRNALGNRDQAYPGPEARAIVEMAYLEMLGRVPSPEEFEINSRWLQEARVTSDTLRQSLMATPQFIDKHGFIDPLDLHTWRGERWLKLILKALSGQPDWPNARVTHEQVFKALFI